MIRLLSPQEGATVLRCTQGVPVTGPLVEMHWQLNAENPRLGHRFYVLEGGVLKLSGNRATLCGTPHNPEELISFLGMTGVRQLTSTGWVPPGWPVAEENRVLVRQPAVVGRRHVGPGFDAAPPMQDVLAVLESTEGRMSPPEAREGFWVDVTIRRNHGAALVYGVWQGAVLAGTAGAYALTGAAAYIACVETLPVYRGQGMATLLLRRLCADIGDRTASLLCREEMAPFYRPFGFCPTGETGYFTCSPA